MTGSERFNPQGVDSRHRELLICFGIVALLFLPFINKAFHIDDFYFLEWGEWFEWNPLRGIPTLFWHYGVPLESNTVAYELTHPLLIPYLIKILLHVFGTNEQLLHLSFLVFPLLALVSLAKLCEFIGGTGQFRTGVLVFFGSLPAFVVNGQNLMADVPTLAFLLAGTAAVVAAGERRMLPWWGALWLTCAVFCSYQAMAFIPVLLLYVLADGRAPHIKWRSVGILLLPWVLMAVWLWLIYLLYGVFPGQKGSGIEGEFIRGGQGPVLLARGVFVFAMVGASLLFVLPLKALGQRSRDLAVAVCLLSVFFILFFFVAPDEVGGFYRRLALAGFCAMGAVGIVLAAVEIKRWWASGEGRPLALLCSGWLAVTLLYNVFVLPFGNARYLLPLFPVLFLVLLRGGDLFSRCSVRLAVVLAFASMLWGGASAWADYCYAGTYRTMAAEIAEFRQTQKDKAQIWYIGEWGMRVYFDQAGARYLPARSLEPRPGDYVIIPEMPKFWLPAMDLRPRLQLYASREFNSPVPLRLFNRRSGAGFYCHHWGMLPFALSSEPDEVFLIMSVQ